MLKRLGRKFVLVVVGVLACAAFVMPAVSSAASWGVVGSTHVLDSPLNSLSFSVPAISAGSTCAVNQFHTTVTSAAVLHVDSAVFGNCMGTGNAVNCTTTPTATGFPWTVTGISTTNIEIHNIHVTVIFENTPGNATTCALPGAVTLTGTLAAPNQTHWDALAHQVTLNAATGLIAHVPGVGTPAATVTGTLRDTSQTLVLS